MQIKKESPSEETEAVLYAFSTDRECSPQRWAAQAGVEVERGDKTRLA